MIYKCEIEDVARNLKQVIHEMESLGNRYYNGRPKQIQEAVQSTRIAHSKLMNLRDHTVRKEGL